MKFLVKKQQIDCVERDRLADGQIAFADFGFVFDNEWAELHKVVQFMQLGQTYNVVLGVNGYSCKMPSGLQAGRAEMSLFGYSADEKTALRATTIPIPLRIEKSGFSSSGSEVIPPSPDLYQQLLGKIDEKIAETHDGNDGKSAYEIAVADGYTGTESEWLQSLKGSDGKDGADGKDGTDGFSPAATVTKVDGVVTITITDANGTTTASLTEPADVDLSGYATLEAVTDADTALSDRMTALESDLVAITSEEIDAICV